MSMNRKIIDTLLPLGLPTQPDQYTGEAKTYFVFNCTSLPDDFGDNAPQHERYLVQVHLFAPDTLNTLDIRKQCKQLLFAAGFTFPAMVDASNEDGQHWVYECELGVAVYG